MATARKVVSPPVETAPELQGPRSPLRSLALLQQLALKADGQTLSELSAAVDAPKTSVLALLRAMVQGHYIRQSGARYRLGDAALVLGTLITASKRPVDVAELPDIAQPFLRSLAEKSGETVFVSALAPDSMEAVYIARAESAHPIRYMASVGERRPLYSSSGGRMLLAFMPSAQQDEYLRQIKPVAFTSKTLTDKKQLRQMLRDIKANGISSTSDDTHLGVSAYGMPVRAQDGEVIAALVLAAPSERVAPQSARMIALLQEHARSLSRALGYVEG